MYKSFDAAVEELRDAADKLWATMGLEYSRKWYREQYDKLRRDYLDNINKRR